MSEVTTTPTVTPVAQCLGVFTERPGKLRWLKRPFTAWGDTPTGTKSVLQQEWIISRLHEETDKFFDVETEWRDVPEGEEE